MLVRILTLRSEETFLRNFYSPIEYVRTGSEPLYNMTNGVNILETSYDAILRGLLLDPAYFGKYPDNVETIFQMTSKNTRLIICIFYMTVAKHSV